MKIKLLFSIIIILTAQIFAQLESIKEFPKEYDTQEIQELTPVWISGDEILVFYTVPTLDTLYSRRTTNRGSTWSAQKFERSIYNANLNFGSIGLTAIKGNNDRILVAWGEDSIKVFYSDDKGLSWSDPDEIPNISFYRPEKLNFTRFQDGRLALTYVMGSWYFNVSNDNGETWLSEKNVDFALFPQRSRASRYLSLISIGVDSLLCFTVKIGTDTICSLFSPDGGESWDEPRGIFAANYSDYPTLKVKYANTLNESIYLVIESNRETQIEEYKQLDVSVIMSNDNLNN